MESDKYVKDANISLESDQNWFFLPDIRPNPNFVQQPFRSMLPVVVNIFANLAGKILDGIEICKPEFETLNNFCPSKFSQIFLSAQKRKSVQCV